MTSVGSTEVMQGRSCQRLSHSHTVQGIISKFAWNPLLHAFHLTLETILPSLLFRQKKDFLYTKVNSDLVCSKDLAWYDPSMHSGNVCAVILFMGYHGTFVILTGVSEHSWRGGVCGLYSFQRLKQPPSCCCFSLNDSLFHLYPLFIPTH